MRRSIAASLHGPTVPSVMLGAVLACDPSGGSAEDVPPGPPPPAPTEPLRPPAVRGPIPQTARVADWEIDARLDADTHRVEATARLAWTNRGPAPVDRIPFHLYLNGFRADTTTWMRDGLLSRRTGAVDPEATWGYCDVSAVVQHGVAGADGPTPLRFSERDEPSLMDVWLAAPLPPGATAELELRFVSQLPRVFARTGFAGDFHMVGQWLPKPGVLDEKGRWHAHPFSLYSEFYADFGRWDVKLDVPSSFVVGATGTRTEAWVEGDRRHERWAADMVHHFAWAAGPDLVERVDEHDGIWIRQLLPPGRVADASDHLDAQVAALDSMQARFGPYPWSTVTIVHPPAGAEGAAGMEYPTLFTTGARVDIPGWLRGLGFADRYSGLYVTVHEFGHQYFQGLLASDESAQPWLDEGLNSMANVMVYEDWFEAEPWIARIAGQPLHLSDAARLRARTGDDLVAIDTPALSFSPVVEVYGGTVYTKTAAVMLTLRELVGHEAFARAMEHYALTWRFRHPTGDDLEATLVEALGRRIVVSEPAPDDSVVELDLPAFFDRALRMPGSVDYAVWDAGNHRLPAEAGFHRDAEGALVEGAPLDRTPAEHLPDDRIEGVAVLRRSGALWVPVEIEAEFADGTEERLVWDGRATHRVLRWPGRRLRRVTIDPDRALYLEARRWNNTAYAPGASPTFVVDRAAGDLGEAVALAILGGVGP